METGNWRIPVCRRERIPKSKDLTINRIIEELSDCPTPSILTKLRQAPESMILPDKDVRLLSTQAETMQELDRNLSDFSELHGFVHETLCESENLLSNQFQTRIKPLRSKGSVCGVEYILRGPRSLRLSAIWAADQNVVYFYNAVGERYLKVKLSNRLDVSQIDQVA
ncbi:hypothetical protein [Thalassoglobus neptunius]|nr:hypothetical protein [Thalassoglobus neptunius]